MNSSQPKNPQQTRLFRIIKLLTHLQPGYLVRSMKNPQVVVILFAVISGGLALGIITTIAFLTEFPLLFPPLGASAFILFYTPMSEQASPRHVILAHTVCLFLGLLSIHFLAIYFFDSNTLDLTVMSWLHVAAIALAMVLSTTVMISFKFEHPPAAATALIASMGYILNSTQIIGFVAAVILLVLEAYLFNRILGGIPYPHWRYNQKIAQDYKELADLSSKKSRMGEQLTTSIFHKR